MGKRAVAAVAGEMWEPAFGAGFQAPRANQESQVSYSSRPPAACHFHSKAANSAHFLRNRIFGLPDGLKSSFSRKPPKMHPSSDSCAVPKLQFDRKRALLRSSWRSTKQDLICSFGEKSLTSSQEILVSRAICNASTLMSMPHFMIRC